MREEIEKTNRIEMLLPLGSSDVKVESGGKNTTSHGDWFSLHTCVCSISGVMIEVLTLSIVQLCSSNLE